MEAHNTLNGNATLRCCCIMPTLELLHQSSAGAAAAAAAGRPTVSFMEPNSILKRYAAAAVALP
jgi:hypothetical protein